MLKRLLTQTLVLFQTTLVWSAPLFPDLPDAHWARDAVASLVAKGLVEGYPDGTFKGDRAASRWETAMIVARLLAQMEQSQATYATRAELEEVRQLVNALRTELDALGVRVTNLEEGAHLLEQRINELERVTFYGQVEARFVSQSFSNSGFGDNDRLRNGAGPPSNVPFLNYHDAVGSAVGATRRPQLHAAFPVVDFKRGKALTNGTGLSSRAILGLNLRVNAEMDAGAEFVAYSSQGDPYVDAYWGVSPPFLSNIFTVNAAAPVGVQPLNNAPFTRMTLDNFWLHHKLSHTRVRLGTIVKTTMDPIVYAGQVNLGVYGPPRWAGFGAQVQGLVDVQEDNFLLWEILGTRIGNGNAFAGTNYQNYVLGGNLAYEFNKGAGKVQVNYVRLAEEASGGGPLLVGGFGPGGGTTGINVAYAASSGWSVFQWVNPPGFFAGQRSSFEQFNSGQLAGGVLIPNTVDRRPIAGWNGAADNAIGFAPGGGGNFGPQAQDIYGLTGRYRWQLGDNSEPALSVAGEWAHSDYRPNKNSRYSAEGDAFRGEVGLEFLEGDLDLEAEYVSVAPNYAPLAYFGNALGARFPRTMNFTGVWHPHNFMKYPHNREGFRLNGTWKFDDRKGTLWAKAAFLDQKSSSLYDVRVLPGGASPGIPNFPVIGFSPGFVDPVFFGFAHPNIYGAASGNSFAASLAPLENPKGSQNSFGLGASYRWEEPALKLSGSYNHESFARRTRLAPAFGGDQNHVDIDVDIFNVELEWDIDERWALTGGVDYTQTVGHFDPSGLYHAFALSTNNATFTNLDSTQTAPYLAVDFEMTKNATWNLTFTHYDTSDEVNPAVRAGTGPFTVGSSAHPFSWDGWQVQSQFNLSY